MKVLDVKAGDFIQLFPCEAVPVVLMTWPSKTVQKGSIILNPGWKRSFGEDKISREILASRAVRM